MTGPTISFKIFGHKVDSIMGPYSTYVFVGCALIISGLLYRWWQLAEARDRDRRRRTATLFCCHVPKKHLDDSIRLLVRQRRK